MIQRGENVKKRLLEVKITNHFDKINSYLHEKYINDYVEEKQKNFDTESISSADIGDSSTDLTSNEDS